MVTEKDAQKVRMLLEGLAGEEKDRILLEILIALAEEECAINGYPHRQEKQNDGKAIDPTIHNR